MQNITESYDNQHVVVSRLEVVEQKENEITTMLNKTPLNYKKELVFFFNLCIQNK